MRMFRVTVVARNPKQEDLATPPLDALIDEVVFAKPGAMLLLGVRTLEGFGAAVGNAGHRFVAETTLVV